MAKEKTSKGFIKGILAKAWDRVKGKPRSERGTKAEVEAKAIERIAEKTGRSEKQIRDIEKGKRPGRNLLDSLKGMFRGRKVKAPPIDEKKVTREKEKPEKPPKEKPPEKPPEQPPEQPPRPKRVKPIVRGNIGPYKDDDYIRERTIRPALSEELTADFLDALEAEDEDRAARIAVKEYFSASGFAGYIESLTDSIDYEVIEESEAQ